MDQEVVGRRAIAKAAYGDLYGQVEALFFRHDPVGINFEENADEYDPEVGTVLPRLESCHNAQDVAAVLHEEFTHWFGADTAGPWEAYAGMALELWQLWQESKGVPGGA